MRTSQQTTIFLHELLVRANQGEESARADLISGAERRLRLLAGRMLARYPHVRRWEETDDIFQNAVMRLHRSLAEVQPETVSAFFGLAATQIRRTLIDLARHYFGVRGLGANHQTDAEGIAAEEVMAQRGPAMSANGGPLSLEDWTRFHESVDHLDEEQREVFHLIWYGGMTQRQVAELLDVSERTVIRRLNRARLSLQRNLADGKSHE